MSVKAAAFTLMNPASTRNMRRPGGGWSQRKYGAAHVVAADISKSMRRITKMKKICKTVLMYAVLTAVMVLMASVDWWVNLV